MPNHIVVILDHSGSMAQNFLGVTSSTAPRGLSASHVTKIDEAKAQLIAWLMTSDYARATIIPFSSASEAPALFVLPTDLDRAKEFLGGVIAVVEPI